MRNCQVVSLALLSEPPLVSDTVLSRSTGTLKSVRSLTSLIPSSKSCALPSTIFYARPGADPVAVRPRSTGPTRRRSKSRLRTLAKSSRSTVHPETSSKSAKICAKSRCKAKAKAEARRRRRRLPERLRKKVKPLLRLRRPRSRRLQRRLRLKVTQVLPRVRSDRRIVAATAKSGLLRQLDASLVNTELISAASPALVRKDESPKAMYWPMSRTEALQSRHRHLPSRLDRIRLHRERLLQQQQAALLLNRLPPHQHQPPSPCRPCAKPCSAP